MQSRKVRVWELANVLRCSHKSVYNYLSGASKLNATRVEAVAEFFDIEPEEFVNLTTGELLQTPVPTG
jgi:predicted transcriptional regulator